MSRLICEQCSHGYAPHLTVCPWCGCSSQMAHTDHTDSMFDTEIYVDYFLAKFSTGEVFQMCEGTPLDIAGLRQALSRYRIVTFNGINFDFPIAALALQGADNATLKQACDAIIVRGLKPWDITDDRLEWADHVDIIEVAPGQASLKMYGAKMHSRKLQDLPIEPSASIRWFERPLLREYCDNDLRTTGDLLATFPQQIRLREDMGAEYGLDLRSRSDAQIAEAVMKSLLPFKVQRPSYAAGSVFYYRPPAWLKFQTLDVLALLARSPFTITESGGVDMPDELAETHIRIGGSAYKMGIGGLHSTEAKVTYRATATHSLRMPDVASYYPSLILRTGIYPAQIGEAFVAIYRSWYDRRMVAKRAGDKKTANSLKTLLNGTFGKLGSKWSIFYAPSEMIQVTVTGQLALLMLIEMLELCGISVVSANTDGVVIYTPRTNDALADSIIKWWEDVTQFQMETSEYEMLACRDVNNYIGITSDGDVKLKGAFAPPDPGASGWPNPTGQICADAVVAYLQHGVLLADTIRACTDIRQFIYVRQVKGGGSYCPNGTLPRRATLSAMRVAILNAGWLVPQLKAVLMSDYDKLCDRVAEEREYLGKAVRWYMSKNSNGCIVTPAGGLVARTDGCRPMMELTDDVPDDLDYDWYIRETESLLVNIGVDTTVNNE